MGNGSEKKQISSRERPFPEEKERGVLEEYLLRGRRIVKRSIGDGDGDAEAAQAEEAEGMICRGRYVVFIRKRREGLLLIIIIIKLLLLFIIN